MKHITVLRRFEYCVPDTVAIENERDSQGDYPFEMHLPQVKVNIDFEKQTLALEGQSRAILGSTQTSKPATATSDKTRVKVKAAIYPGSGISLDDFTNEGLAFSLDGIIDDGEKVRSCSGLLVLDSAIGRKASEWYMTVYLYDDCDDDREIKLRFAMYAFSENAELN